MKRIIATIFVFGFGIAMALVLSRRYTQPIQRVVDAARRVAAGDMNQQIPVKSKDEIGQLSESFNYMVLKLKEMHSLEEKLREAGHLSGIDLISRDIAHEIRNPLNFINLSIDHISEKYLPVEKERQELFTQLINGIKIEVQRLNFIVNDFLNYSKPIRLSLSRLKVGDLLDDVIALIWAKAEAEGITIKKDYESDAEINVDAILFKSCLLNIITNAFQSFENLPSNREKTITVKTSSSGDKFILSVTDNGAGISPDNMRSVFEPFFTTKETGIGIGLSMTKRVIEEHGGNIMLKSTQGSGTEVKLILPVDNNRENL